MGFYSNAISHLKFIDTFSQGSHGAGVFVARGKIAIGGLSRQGVVHQGHIGAAASTGFDFKQYFHRPGLRGRDLPDFQLIAAHQEGRLHGFGYSRHTFLLLFF
jgi:hypothetical protein